MKNLSRRGFMKSIGLAAAVFASGGCGNISSLASSKNVKRPNILLILGDDIGRETISCCGGESYSTPNIDKLAATGMRFKNCYATPICSPTRVELLTGKYSFRNYTKWRQLKGSETTFPQILQKHGYRTALAGKWQLEDWDEEPKGIEKAGYDEYLSLDHPKMLAYSKRDEGNVFWKIPTLYKNGEHIEPGYEYGEDLFFEFTKDFISRETDKPWLMEYHMNLCHRPFMPTPDSEVIKNGGKSAIDNYLGFEGETKYFSDMLSYADKLVGKLVDVLEKTGQRDNTLVIFTADNGTDNVWEAKKLRSEYRNRMVEGGKYKISDLGAAVPFIANFPGVVKSGVVTEELIDFSDILPSFCDAAGAKLPEGLETDGRSFMPVLKGDNSNAREWIYSWGGFIKTSRRYKDPVKYKDEHLHIIRNKRWKYYSDGRIFDMKNDPFEERAFKEGENKQADKARKLLKSELAKLRSSGRRLW
ncbi:sulfatase-like hydrolase/transferase [Sedimentisphaera salicampi]|uniref:Choline-sulfatase n=1 Tax=Sedimentisphaera salicampi TaxID=1941349 RepID=A0A1W6LNN2_9BACT|nr:sulfatase-like hydrolase/transferase [Sedimentisphaera salicampi]ARN57352.1 Choline-sulfatase [Sedimentisphaera salicampi]